MKSEYVLFERMYDAELHLVHEFQGSLLPGQNKYLVIAIFVKAEENFQLSEASSWVTSLIGAIGQTSLIQSTIVEM